MMVVRNDPVFSTEVPTVSYLPGILTSRPQTTWLLPLPDAGRSMKKPRMFLTVMSQFEHTSSSAGLITVMAPMRGLELIPVSGLYTQPVGHMSATSAGTDTPFGL